MKNSVQSIHNFRKSVQYWEENFLNFFGLFFIRFLLANPCVISSKTPWSIQCSKQRSFTVLINNFSQLHVSYCPFVCMWHGRILHNRIFRLHLQEKNIHHINVFSLETDLFLSIMAIWKLLLLHNVRILKASLQKYLIIK